MMTTLLAIALLVGASAATAQAPELNVKYRSATSVYVSGGRAEGLKVGDRLRVTAGGAEVGELEVVFLADHSASCRVLREARPLKAGDTVVRIGSTAPAPRPADSPGPPTSASPPPSASAPVRPTPTMPRTWGRLSGGLSVGWQHFWDGSPSPRDQDQRTVRFDLSLRDVAGRPYTVRARGRSRQDERGGAISSSARHDRLHELSLAYEPVGSRVSGMVGRIGAVPFVSIGTLDGVVGQYQAGSGLEIGGFLGRNGDREGLGLQSSGSKYGAFLRMAPPSSRLQRHLVLSGVRELGKGGISREYFGVEGQLRSDRFWIYERSEVDWNRGWRRDASGRSFQLSDVTALARYTPSPARSLSVAYDRRRNYRTAETRDFPDDLLDDFLRQGLRLTLDLGRPGSVSTWVGGGIRHREQEERHTYSLSAGLRHPDVFSFGAALQASAFTNLYTEGVLTTARLGRTLARGHQWDASYGASVSRLRSDKSVRFQQWVRAFGYASLGRGAFLLAELDYGRGDDFRGPRATLELGYRQ